MVRTLKGGLLLATLAMAACGPLGGGTHAANSTLSPLPNSHSESPSPTLTHPCDLLTTAQVETAMGVPPAQTNRGTPFRGLTTCQWLANLNTSPVDELDVGLIPEKDAASAEAYFQMRTAAEAVSKPGSTVASYQPIPSLSASVDQAAVFCCTHVWARKARVVLYVALSGSDSNVLARAQAVAVIVAAKLPS
jgi:uncharacterized protein DUF3558